ncbi:MAG: fumarylacetoacetate hydrolase family protein [Pseudomonadota bacterium]|nr:fumarylacetoacetate hydrolase family protein [Pseudomonadota bacterium]
MRWARFEQNGGPTYGIVEGDDLIPVRGSPFERWERSGAPVPLAQAKLLIPVVPSTFYAAGLNYGEHAIAAADKLGRPPSLPDKPDIGYRANNALIAHDEPIVIPKDATVLVQYEGELVVVIGRTCKHLTREDALAAVLGYTIGNDVSERTWQRHDRTLWRAKNTDTFKPMGPWIETNVRLDDLTTKVRLNGNQEIEFPTNKMVFSVVDYLVAMSRYLTLHAGDVVWMGTEGEATNMKHGDVCEVEITGIGTLSNPVLRDGEG